MFSGILNVNKPAGLSSFGVVRSLRRLPGIKAIGHGGTLDPAADGVLPVLLGRATRLSAFIHEWPKAYQATVQLGSTSDTDDSEGVIRATGDWHAISKDAIEGALPEFTGRIRQIPPAFSAVKRAGEPLYRKARRGEPVTADPREVDIFELRLVRYDPLPGVVGLELNCGSGTYVRSLARDLGHRLGCGAYLKGLTRTAVGPLQIRDAISPTALAAAADGWQRWLLPMDLPLRDWPALVLDAEQARAISHGQSITTGRAAGSGRHRFLDEGGRLLAWGIVDEAGRLTPRAVFTP